MHVIRQRERKEEREREKKRKGDRSFDVAETRGYLCA